MFLVQSPSSNHVPAVVLGVALIGVVIAAAVMGIIAAVFIRCVCLCVCMHSCVTLLHPPPFLYSKHSSVNRRYLQLASTGSEGRMEFRRNPTDDRTSSAQPLVVNISKYLFFCTQAHTS